MPRAMFVVLTNKIDGVLERQWLHGLGRHVFIVQDLPRLPDVREDVSAVVKNLPTTDHVVICLGEESHQAVPPLFKRFQGVMSLLSCGGNLGPEELAGRYNMSPALVSFAGRVANPSEIMEVVQEFLSTGKIGPVSVQAA